MAEWSNALALGASGEILVSSNLTHVKNNLLPISRLIGRSRIYKHIEMSTVLYATIDPVFGLRVLVFSGRSSFFLLDGW